MSARLIWKDQTLMVTLSNDETQNVMKGLTGFPESGTFSSLMGCFGSSKSTLLDALLSWLAFNAFLSWTILLNDVKPSFLSALLFGPNFTVKSKGKSEFVINRILCMMLNPTLTEVPIIKTPLA